MGWFRRTEEKRVSLIKRWESNPSRFWWVPLLGAIALAGSYAWILVATDANPFGPAWGVIIGFLLLYAFSKKPGSRMSHKTTRQMLSRRIILGGGILLLVMGVLMLLGAAGIIESSS